MHPVAARRARVCFAGHIIGRTQLQVNFGWQTHSKGPSLCQITRCDRNRHSRERGNPGGQRTSVCCPPGNLGQPLARPACFRLPGAPKTVSLANSLPPRPTLNLPPSPCVCHIAYPMSPERPNAHLGRPTSPTHDPVAPSYPEKKCHSRASPVPTPAQSNPAHVPPLPHGCIISSHKSVPIPQSRQPPGNIRTTVLPSPTRGTDPAARKSCPQTGCMPQASVGASLVSARWQLGTFWQGRHGRSTLLRPPALLCHAASLLCHRKTRRALQNRAGPPAPSATKRTECRRNEQISHSREACPRGSMP